MNGALSLLALMWAVVLFYRTADSRKKAQSQVEGLRRHGFNADYLLKGNIYVLFDQTSRKIAFVFRDRSYIHDYGDVRSITRYWLGFLGLKLKNTMVFTLHNKKIRCRNLSARQAEYWHRLSAELVAPAQ